MKASAAFNFTIAALLLFAVLYNVVLWFQLSSVYTGTFLQLKNEYLQHFPTPLQNARLITLLDVVACAIAALLYRRIYIHPQAVFFKTLSFLLFLLCLLLIAWLLFTLM